MTDLIADDFADIRKRMRDVITRKALEDVVIPESIKALAARIEPTGSRYICDPPPTDTDSDWIVLLLSKYTMSDVEKLCAAEGLAKGGSEVSDRTSVLPDDSVFKSFKSDVLNLIVTQDKVFFARFVHATQLAKQFNLLKKDDRIALFSIILYFESTF